MTELTLQIKQPEDLELMLQLAKRLRIPYSQPSNGSGSKKKNLQEAIQYILSYENENPSFGDALEWQRREREDRDLRL
jgi:hypothetical protein